MAVNLPQSQGQMFGPAGANHAPGLVPDPGSASHNFPYLLGDDGNFHSINGMLSVVDFGADPTGSKDSTTAFQKAIVAAAGGDLFVPAGNYAISSTVKIGNGSASAVSTQLGVRLIGAGTPLQPVGFAGYPTNTPTRIFWTGAAAGTMFQIAGPLQGWGIENLLIDGMSLANVGLSVVSAQYGDCRNLVIIGCETWGLFSTAVAPFGSVTFTGSFHNRYDNLTIKVPSAAVGGGIILTGVSTANTLFNAFFNTTVAIVGSSQNGIYLQAAAGNVFVGGQISGLAGDTSFVFDYGVNSSWPANNLISGFEPVIGATVASNSGSPGGSATPNYLLNLITTDGATYPVLANLVTDRVLTDLNALTQVASPSNANASSAGVPVGGLYTSTADPHIVYQRTA